MSRGRLLFAGLAASVALGGCLAPSIVMVDRKTSLEQQAAGTYPTLGRELEEAGVAPSPSPLTREQLVSATPAAATSAPAADASETSDAARAQALLVRRCLGEALDGLLVETRASCSGTPDEQELARLLARSNRTRQQAWSYLQSLHPAATPAAVRAAWRTTHLRELACGAQVQQPDKSWEAKKC